MDEAIREALTIEDAETEILKLSKTAVLSGWSAERYRKAVEKVIETAKKNAKSIADKIETALKEYATKCVNLQRSLVNSIALVFAVSLSNAQRLEDNIPNVQRLEDITDKDILKSNYFTQRVNQYRLASPNQMYMREYMQEVREKYAELIETNAQENYASNVSLRNVAEMTVRYDHQTAMIDRMAETTRLVYIVPHPNCSKRCERYQGRVYSMDGTSGTIDGHKFVPLEVATEDMENPERGKYGYINGCITGFGCRHPLKPYTNGTIISEIPAETIAKQRAINNRQRAYERKIRHYKKAAVEYGDSPKGRQSRKNAIAENKRYRDFCEKNGVTYYPDRTKIFD